MSPQTSPLILLTDRSAAETDDKCGMKFWLQRKEGGTGIVPKEHPVALRIGAEVHDDFRTIAGWHDLSPAAVQAAIDDILAGLDPTDKIVQSKMELLYRRLGWIASWALFHEGKLRENWVDVAVEKELVLDRSPLWVATTPDRVLRSLRYGYLKYMEYKSTISTNQKWMSSWRYAIQLHIGIAAVQEEMDLPIKFGEIVALNKGQYSYDGRLLHPYVWGWYNAKTGKWTSKYDEARSGDWTKMPVWEYPGGVVEWVLNCGEDTANAQFPKTAPIMLDERLLAEWVARRTAREQQIKLVEDDCRENVEKRSLYFERRQGQCRPPFGDACPYELACWNAEVAKDPASHPDYVKRVPHHDLETVGLI